MGSWRAPSVPASSVREVAHRLTKRDFAIITDLARFRLFTLEQLQRLYFDSNSSARDRITTLTEMGLLQRFRPHTRDAYRYLLGLHGLKLVHANRVEDYERDPVGPVLGERKPKPGRVPSKASAEAYAERIIASAHRSHLEGCNDFYSRLTASCRKAGGVDLERWYTEAEADSIAPLTDMRADGAFDLATPHGMAAMCYEYDTGTEPLARLVQKAETFTKDAERKLLLRHNDVESGRYRDYRVVGYMVIELTKPQRETNFHRELAQRGSPFLVATTTADRSADPLSPIWRQAGTQPASRRHLVTLTDFR
jgi:hypothetical protein